MLLLPYNAGSERSPRSAAFRLQKRGIRLRHRQISTLSSCFTPLQPEGCAPGGGDSDTKHTRS